jgi:hypothetical protein
MEIRMYVLDQAGEDLGFVEAALISIHRSLISGMVRASSPEPAFRLERGIRQPDLPRCSAYSATGNGPCQAPATHPKGLCPGHFRGKYGHMAYRIGLRHTPPATQYGCTKCQLTWRGPHPTYVSAYEEVLQRERAAALRSVCPWKEARLLETAKR